MMMRDGKQEHSVQLRELLLRPQRPARRSPPARIPDRRHPPVGSS